MDEFYRDFAKHNTSIALGMSNFAFEEDYENLRKSCGTYEAYADELDWCETVDDYLEWEEDCKKAIEKARAKENSTLVKWLDELMYLEKEEVGELFHE